MPTVKSHTKQILAASALMASVLFYSCDNDKSDDNEVSNLNTGIDTSSANMQNSNSTDVNSDKGAVATDTVSFGKSNVTGVPDSTSNQEP